MIGSVLRRDSVDDNSLRLGTRLDQPQGVVGLVNQSTVMPHRNSPPQILVKIGSGNRHSGVLASWSSSRAHRPPVCVGNIDSERPDETSAAEDDPCLMALDVGKEDVAEISG